MTAVVAGAESQAFAPAGWVSYLVTKNPKGISQQYLVLGDAPVPWATVRALNVEQVLAISRDAIVNYPPAERPSVGRSSWRW